MSMGRRKRDRQPAMWVTTTQLPTAASHPFYRRLIEILRGHGFDDFVEAECARFFAETMGRPGLPPGIYFRLLLIGYFEGIDAERGIAWRAADSLALRDYAHAVRRRHAARPAGPCCGVDRPCDDTVAPDDDGGGRNAAKRRRAAG